MIIPLNELKSDFYYHSDYQHLHIDTYPTSTEKETPSIAEFTRFGNPFDFINPQYYVSYDVYAGERSDEKLEHTFTLPDGCKLVSCNPEPYTDKDGNDTFAYFYVFEKLEDAYNYAITQRVQ